MNERETIYKRIKDALEPLQERTPYPDWPDELVISKEMQKGSGWDLFSKKLVEVNGTPIKGLDELGKWMQEQNFMCGYCDPFLIDDIALHPAMDGIQFDAVFDRGDIDRYDFGITPASGAIAETGTIILTDEETTRRLGALAPWAHIAILAPDRLHPDIPSAIETFGKDPNIIWCTGPSKTADVEGILIEGVHGPGVQVCCLCEL